MCTHKAQKYDFRTHQAHFSPIWAIGEPPMALIAKMVEKSIKMFQIFSQKIHHEKSSETQFHQKIPKRAIVALSLQDMKNTVWRKMGSTVIQKFRLKIFI